MPSLFIFSATFFLSYLFLKTSFRKIIMLSIDDVFLEWILELKATNS